MVMGWSVVFVYLSLSRDVDAGGIGCIVHGLGAGRRRRCFVGEASWFVGAAGRTDDNCRWRRRWEVGMPCVVYCVKAFSIWMNRSSVWAFSLRCSTLSCRSLACCLSHSILSRHSSFFSVRGVRAVAAQPWPLQPWTGFSCQT